MKLGVTLISLVALFLGASSALPVANPVNVDDVQVRGIGGSTHSVMWRDSEAAAAPADSETETGDNLDARDWSPARIHDFKKRDWSPSREHDYKKRDWSPSREHDYKKRDWSPAREHDQKRDWSPARVHDFKREGSEDTS